MNMNPIQSASVTSCQPFFLPHRLADWEGRDMLAKVSEDFGGGLCKPQCAATLFHAHPPTTPTATV